MNTTDGIEIPYQQLSAETLQAIIEAFVLQEGTNYGEKEVTLETKVEQVRRQLEVGKAKLVFDPESETCNLVTAEPRHKKDLQCP